LGLVIPGLGLGSRWLELRLAPPENNGPGRLWAPALALVGLILVLHREGLSQMMRRTSLPVIVVVLAARQRHLDLLAVCRRRSPAGRVGILTSAGPLEPRSSLRDPPATSVGRTR
jgi:hypothetical protein